MFAVDRIRSDPMRDQGQAGERKRGESVPRALSRGQTERLIDLSRRIFSELDLDTLLDSVISAARDLTGARYAALGIVDAEHRSLDRFAYLGIDEETRRRIGPLPEGLGVLGELIGEHATPLRLADLTGHPRSYGFPAGHPEMRTFLGVPIKVRGEAWGNIYLTEKAGGQPFTDSDERLVTILAEWTSVAVENADLHARIQHRRRDLEQAVLALRTSTALARAAAAGMDHGQLQLLIAERGRDLAGARRCLLLLPTEDGRLEVVAAAGEGEADELVGLRLKSAAGVVASVLHGSSPLNLDPEDQGIPGLDSVTAAPGAALMARLDFRDERPGMIVALGPTGRERFGPGEERLFESVADSVAMTLMTARAAENAKLRLAMDASERERRRWARELHDETLQELGALQVMIEEADVAESPDRARDLLARATDHVERSIRHLQATITELRPAVLDELGAGPAVLSLVEQVSVDTDLDIEARVELDGDGGEGERLGPELESTLYRLVQEGLSNVSKHSGADRVKLDLAQDGDRIELELSDDGCGFDPGPSRGGFGLLGMRERISLAGGELSIESRPGYGTRIRVSLPTRSAKTSTGFGGEAVATGELDQIATGGGAELGIDRGAVGLDGPDA